MTRYAWGGIGGRNKPPTLMELFSVLGVADHVLCCLDAGVSASYPGTGDTWFDLSGNGRNVVVPSGRLGTFHGTPDGRSPNEYFEIPAGGGSGGNRYQQLIPDTAFNFMDPWHTAAANFTVIVGMKIKDTTTQCSSVIATGVVVNAGFISKGFALHRANGSGTPNGFNNFKTAQRMYAVYKGTSNGDANAPGVDTGLNIPNGQFLMVMAAIKDAEQNFRVNSSANTTNISWGAGNTNPSTFGYREYPDRSPAQPFGASGTMSAWQISHMAFLDAVLSPTQLQNIYNAFKQYRDRSLP
jgi:hypothetical protein